MCHETSAVPVAARILVVDDHADYAESVAKLLELLGHEVQVASDGPHAIASALLWQPDFILLELGLPGMDGYQVAARLRQEASCQKTVIIAVSGYGLPKDRQQSHTAGINFHLLKPIDIPVLQSLLIRSQALSNGQGPSPGDPDISAAAVEIVGFAIRRGWLSEC